MPTPLEDALLRSFPPPGMEYARNLVKQYKDEPTAKILRELQRGDAMAARAFALAKYKAEHPDEEPTLTQSLQNFWGRLTNW